MIRQKSTATVNSAPALSADAPHPSDIFDFLPYACLQLCLPFTVRFLIHEDMPPVCELRRRGKCISQVTSASAPYYYGDAGTSNEVLIDAVKSPGKISLKLPKVSRQIIMLLELAAPHCTTFERLTIPRLHLPAGLIRKISHLLKISNISELFLDGSTSSDGKYELLLEGLNHLTLLSLDRCYIGDDVCVRIAAALTPPAPASSTLNVLSLSTNKLTDKGAKALALMLRTNRSLCHLNLSGNPITDIGAGEIISSLGEFPLTSEELLGMRSRYMEYLKLRNSEYEKAYREVLEPGVAGVSRKVRTRQSRTSVASASSRRPNSPGSRSPGSRSPKRLSPQNLKQRAEQLAKSRVGPFTHVFNFDETERRETVRYCRGNRKLKSLNLAYTEVTIEFVDKLVQVLRMQAGGRGLVRVEVAGAPIPASCPVLDDAKVLLKAAMENQFKLSPRKK